MATQILTQQPAVIPFPSTKETVPQTALRQVVELRQQIDRLTEQLKSAEGSIRQRLEGGADVESGLLTARLKVVERRNVSWKSVCERQLGEAYCTRVLAATKPTTSKSLVVEAK